MVYESDKLSFVFFLLEILQDVSFCGNSDHLKRNLFLTGGNCLADCILQSSAAGNFHADNCDAAYGILLKNSG